MISNLWRHLHWFPWIFVTSKSRRYSFRVESFTACHNPKKSQIFFKSAPTRVSAFEYFNHFLWWIFRSPMIIIPLTSSKYILNSFWNWENPSWVVAPGRYQLQRRKVSVSNLRKCQLLSSTELSAIWTRQLKSSRCKDIIPPLFVEAWRSLREIVVYPGILISDTDSSSHVSYRKTFTRTMVI